MSAETLTEQEADKIFADFESQPAQITEDQMYAMAQKYLDLGVSVRAGLAMLSRSGADLVEWVKDDRDFALAAAVAANSISECAGKMKELGEMLDSSALRLSLALCAREDMRELMEEAEDPKHYKED
jgi:hypothetical protein